jgi:2',3'-cyclic-nucleotide 2'-phosphodiesterase (5'-nucleotidase family)
MEFLYAPACSVAILYTDPVRIFFFFGFQVGRQNGTQVSQLIGYLTIGDVLEILPFEDPLVVLEISGKTLWEALEASLATWPAQEG